MVQGKKTLNNQDEIHKKNFDRSMCLEKYSQLDGSMDGTYAAAQCAVLGIHEKCIHDRLHCPQK